MRISPERAWNTWDATAPGCFIHLPSGFGIRLSAFDRRANRLERFGTPLTEDGSSITLGTHTTDGSLSRVQLALGDQAHFDVTIAKVDPFNLVGSVALREQSAWNAYLWVNLEVGYLSVPAVPGRESDEPVHVLDAEAGQVHLVDSSEVGASRSPTVAARWRSQEFRVATSIRPTHVGLYGHPDELQEDYELRGTSFVRANAPGPKSLAAFRFIGEKLPPFFFAAAQSPDPVEAEAVLAESLGNAGTIIEEATVSTAKRTPWAAAVRDVVGWNTVWDRDNSRSYTCLSRNWIRMLGGRGIWLTDVIYNGLLAAAAGDFDLAESNLEAVLFGQQANGIIPCLMAGSMEWVDRTQFPVPAYMAWRIYLRTRDRVSLERFYPILLRYQNWHYRRRDGNGNGLLEHGSDPYGLAAVAGSRWAAINESGMDNLAVFDEASFDERTHTLDFEEIGHNSMLVLGFEALSKIAHELGRHEESQVLAARGQLLAEIVREELWDDRRAIFAGRLWDGRFAEHLAPTSFFPLLAGIASEEQAEILVTRHLLDPSAFGGDLVVPTTPRTDPVAHDNAYWRGRIWPPLNFMIWDGLRRYGYWSEATELAHKSWQIFNRGWAARRHAHENFQMFPATGCDAQDSDEFYSWGAMMPLISVLDVTDASPWHGITLVAPTASSERSELETGEGTYALTTLADGTGTMLERDGVPVIRLASRVRISDLRMAEGLIAFSFQPLDGHARVQLDLVGVPSSAVVAAFVEDQPVPLAGGTATCSFEVDASAEGAVRIELHHRSTFAAGTHSGAIHRVAFP